MQDNIKDRQAFNDGHVLFREGQPASWVYLIVSGAVEIYQIDQPDKRHEAGPGEFEGVSAVLGGANYTSSGKVKGGAVVISISQEMINAEFKKMNKLGQNFFSSVIDRLNNALK